MMCVSPEEPPLLRSHNVLKVPTKVPLRSASKKRLHYTDMAFLCGKMQWGGRIDEVSGFIYCTFRELGCTEGVRLEWWESFSGQVPPHLMMLKVDSGILTAWRRLNYDCSKLVHSYRGWDSINGEKDARLYYDNRESIGS